MMDIAPWMYLRLTETANAAEVIWVLFNVTGMTVAFCAWTLSRADRQRLIVSGLNGGLRELAEDGEREEFIRFLKHTGNMMAGVLALLAPTPVRDTLQDFAEYVALWLIMGAGLLMYGTVMHLRARYRFGMYWRFGHRGTTWGFFTSTLREVYDVVIKRGLGGYMNDSASTNDDSMIRTIASPDIIGSAPIVAHTSGSKDDVLVIPMAEWKQAAVRGIRSAVQFYLLIAGGGTIATAATGIGLPPTLLLGLPSTGNLYVDSLIVTLVAGLVVFVWNVVEFWMSLDERYPQARA